jgi:hypothetical protein
MVDALLQEAGSGRLSDGPIGSESPPALRRDQTAAEAGSVDAGVYVYGFATGDGEGRASPTGVNDLPTSTITHHQVAAIVSEMCGAPAAWDIGESGTADLAAIGARAQEHERVLQAVLETGPVIPVRLGTVYPSPEAVLETLRAHYRAIHTALEALDGKVEWGLTVACDRERVNPVDSESRPSPQAKTGRGYLNRREAEKVAAERVATQRREVARELHRSIEELAAGSVVHPTRRPRGASRSDVDVMLRASYLVDKADGEQFKQAIVDALETAGVVGLTGELTGPWPAYNFSRLELEGAQT